LLAVFSTLEFESNYCKKSACTFWLSSGQQLEELLNIAIGLQDLIAVGINPQTL
jgi:hypothetical protein